MIPDSLTSKANVTDPDHALWRMLLESRIDCALFTVSRGGCVMSWNAGAQRLFGYSPADIVGGPIEIIFTPQDVQADVFRQECEAVLAGEPVDSDRWHVRRDGSTFWGAKSVVPLFDDAGSCNRFAILMRDMTTVHVAFEELSDSERNLRSILDGVHDHAIFSLAMDGTVTSWNAGAENVFGYTALEMVGVNFSVLYPTDDVRGGVPSAELCTARVSGSTKTERMLVKKDGTPFLACSKLRERKAVLRGEAGGFVNVVSDITERAAAESDLRRRADFDELTQLPNRRTFHAHVQRAIASMRRRSADLFAVLFIDVDYFKQVNDAYGHIVADRLLASIARRLEHCMRADDVVARLGGDEFGILITGISGVGDVVETADRIAAEMQRPRTIEGTDIGFTVSMGIALGKLAYERPEDILRDADSAMYEAKRSGRARAVVFDA